jgi:hypothetical protein
MVTISEGTAVRMTMMPLIRPTSTPTTNVAAMPLSPRRRRPHFGGTEFLAA